MDPALSPVGVKTDIVIPDKDGLELVCQIKITRYKAGGPVCRPPCWRKVDQAYPIQAGRIDVNFHRISLHARTQDFDIFSRIFSLRVNPA